MNLIAIIYEVRIGNNYYIGKDKIGQREGQHRRMLERNSHYNSFMQNSYNKYRDFNFRVLKEVSDEEAGQEEIKTIQEYRQKGKNLMNLTLGGDGGRLGATRSDEERKASSEANRGELNPMSKLKDSDVLAMYDMFREGKSNLEVATVFGVHDRYVSLIRHGKRFGHIHSKQEESFVDSMANAGLSYKQFVEVVSSEESNLEIGKRMKISPSSISRLRNKKSYLPYWKIYEKEQ